MKSRRSCGPGGWARAQPPGPELRREFIPRYAEVLQLGRPEHLMRFFDRNPTALRGHPEMERMRGLLFDIIGVVCPPGCPPVTRLRYAMGLFALNATWFVLRDPEVTDEERQAAAITVALELVDLVEAAEAATAR